MSQRTGYIIVGVWTIGATAALWALSVHSGAMRALKVCGGVWLVGIIALALFLSATDPAFDPKD